MTMDLLQWALIAFVVAIVAGFFGFTGVAQGAASIGRVLFGLFPRDRRDLPGTRLVRRQYPGINLPG
jgi:uncharacterized membrane protein YtjA (UPF0391 family)